MPCWCCYVEGQPFVAAPCQEFCREPVQQVFVKTDIYWMVEPQKSVNFRRKVMYIGSTYLHSMSCTFETNSLVCSSNFVFKIKYTLFGKTFCKQTDFLVFLMREKYLIFGVKLSMYWINRQHWCAVNTHLGMTSVLNTSHHDHPFPLLYEWNVHGQNISGSDFNPEQWFFFSRNTG